MTRRLYYDDSYRLEFEARVESLDHDAEGRPVVVLDETCLYPTSGGQMHDHGRLGGIALVDVVDHGDVIHHVLASEPDFAVGDVVAGTVDADRRRHHRQQHTGQHVLSRVLEERHGLPTVSSRLGESGNTLDVESTDLTLEILDALEDATNRVLWEGRPVRIRYLGEGEAAERGLRKKSDRDGPLRVIDVEDVDLCACGGTHVRNTAEVGMVALTGLEKVRGGMRIHFLCGERALAARRTDSRALHAMAASMTTGADQLPEILERLQQENKALQKNRQRVAQELVQLRAPGWIGEARRKAPPELPFLWVARILDDDEALAGMLAVQSLTRADGIVATLLVGTGGRGQLLVGRSDDVDLDARALLEGSLARVGGRGGGSAAQARGGFGKSSAEEVLRAIETELRALTSQ